MTTSLCEQLSDRMPAVASGAARWTAADQEHLATCAACGDEWALVQAAARLDFRADNVVAADELARTVLERVRSAERGMGGARAWLRSLRAFGAQGDVRSPKQRHRVRRWQVGLAAAAAAILAIMVWQNQAPTVGEAAPATVERLADFRLPLAELDDADSTDLAAALRAFDASFEDASTLEPLRAGDLEDDDYARVLRAMEG